MALIFNQTPPTLSLAQSPIVFSVVENTGLYGQDEFQYTCQLTYWTGSGAISGSYDYYLTKYPNTSGVGIFDVSRVLNSALNQLSYQYSSSVLYYNAGFNYNYLSGSVRVSGSNQPTLVGGTYKSLDGYSIFPEPINEPTQDKSIHWPLMTDGPPTQSVLPSDIGQMGVYVGVTGGSIPTKVVYSGSLGNGSVTVTATTSSMGQIIRVPSAPSQSTFPVTVTDGSSYSLQAYSGSIALGTSILYNVVCPQYYPPVRIGWKNRYGQFDFLNFYLVNRKTFGTSQKTYQPQLGSWDSTTLSYNEYQSNLQRYIVDTNEVLEVNTNYLPEAQNEIMKQLLVSDEIYWYYDQAGNYVKPLTVKTNNLRFKTGVNDKLIQYTITFDIGQTFKLIL